MMWKYVIIAVAAVLLVAAVVTIVEISKVRKKTKAAESKKSAVKVSVQEKKSAPVADKTSVPTVGTTDEEEILAANDRFDDKEEKKEEEKEVVAATEEPAIEKKKEPAAKTETKKDEPKKKPSQKEKPVEEEKAPKKEKKKTGKTEVVENKKAPKKDEEEKKKVAEKEEKEASVKTEIKEETPVAEPVKEEKKEKGKVFGKIEICNSDLGGFSYILRANNGQLLYESKTYKSVASCTDAVKNFVEAVKAGMFSVRADKFHRYKFILKSPTSNNIIYVGESFDNERSCQSNIESVCRFAEISEIVDITEADFKAKFVPYVISDEVKEKVKNNNGVVGKWTIEQVDEENKKNSPYVFLLYASNGQLLYESRDYSSYGNCKNGLETFRKAVSEGQFIIDPDKSGRFKFILRNVNKNSLMEYIGQNYSSERACAEGIDSIYRFALVSPTDKL